jgi:hypothetical protein
MNPPMTLQEKITKVMYRTVKNWDDEEVLCLWHNCCDKVKNDGESDKVNGIIDACWKIIQERDLIPPAG